MTSSCTASQELTTNEGEDVRSWADNFRARPPVEEVRNCTRLSTDLKSSIVQIIASALLKSSSDTVRIETKDGAVVEWRTGGNLC